MKVTGSLVTVHCLRPRQVTVIPRPRVSRLYRIVFCVWAQSSLHQDLKLRLLEIIAIMDFFLYTVTCREKGKSLV